MSAERRTARDDRRRRLGQNFLRPDAADRLVAGTDVRPGQLIVEPGAGTGAIALALARRGAEVVAVELDPVWAHRLGELAQSIGPGRVRVIQGDFLSVRLPSGPFRVIGCPPYGQTTALLRRLLSDRGGKLARADLILQWEVARKRASGPPATLLSTIWAPWWEFELGVRVLRIPSCPTRGRWCAHHRAPRPCSPAGHHDRRVRRFVTAHWPFQARRGS